MDDEALKRFGEAAAFMCSREANFVGEDPRPEFVIQLEESRAEWRRRHPKGATGGASLERQGQ